MKMAFSMASGFRIVKQLFSKIPLLACRTLDPLLGFFALLERVYGQRGRDLCRASASACRAEPPACGWLAMEVDQDLCLQNTRNMIKLTHCKLCSTSSIPLSSRIEGSRTRYMHGRQVCYFVAVIFELGMTQANLSGQHTIPSYDRTHMHICNAVLRLHSKSPQGRASLIA